MPLLESNMTMNTANMSYINSAASVNVQGLFSPQVISEVN